jgi:hypothetical protein
MRGDKRLDHACQLWTHYLGWEIRLEINRDLQRSEPSRRTEILLVSSHRHLERERFGFLSGVTAHADPLMQIWEKQLGMPDCYRLLGIWGRC